MPNVYLRFDRNYVPVDCIPNNFLNRKKFITNQFVFLHNSNIKKMNVFELAHQVNDRLNDGDESKFPITLIVVSEYLYILKPINYFGWFTYMISSGNSDEVIMDTIRSLNDEYEIDPLGLIIRFQNSSRLINQFFREKNLKYYV